MGEPQGDINGQGGEPTVPPTGTNPQGTSEPNPPSSTPNAGGDVRYDELLRNPSFREFFDRQVEKAIEKRFAQGAPQHQQNNDAIGQVTHDLIEEFGLDQAKAKKLIGVFNAVVQHNLDKSLGDVRTNMRQIASDNKLRQFALDHADMWQYQGKMKELFNEMDDIAKEFVVNHPSGIETLYWKAKAISKPSNPNFSGTSASGAPSQKIAENTTVKGASESLLKGDRASFNKFIASVGR